ncbi:MAG: methyltransferase domain-containing protein [Chloroflexota bacterium]|nr:methyltransferase domain-containing protein [Chloroflexota bacterium]
MEIINPERYYRLIAEAKSAPFTGWDFNWLDDRMIQQQPPWDYPAMVRKHLETAASLLDMGTGGGELLASLAPLPQDCHATEAFPPNQALARKQLSPLNVTLHDIQKNVPLPFNKARFDLVINRHDDFDPAEVFRVLKSGGRFITQQVGGLNNLELNQVLEDKLSSPFTDWCLVYTLTGLYEAGFIVEVAQKAALTSIFMDIGAVVYYLKAIPWQVENFSPETHNDPLIQLHNIIERQGQFVSTAHRFLIIGHKKE